MSDGLIDAERGAIIAAYTGSLSAEDAAKADEILAAAAPEVRADTLARRAAAMEMKLDPEAAKTRKEKTKRVAQRVQVQLERSGNASVAGRELDIADALASKANIHATALRLRRAGLEGSLDRLRATVFNDLLQGRNPFDRLAPIPEASAAHDASGEEDAPAGDPEPEAERTTIDDSAPPEVPIPENPADGWTPSMIPVRTRAWARTGTRLSAAGPAQATLPALTMSQVTRTTVTTRKAQRRQAAQARPAHPLPRLSTFSSTRAPSSAGTPRHHRQADGGC